MWPLWPLWIRTVFGRRERKLPETVRKSSHPTSGYYSLKKRRDEKNEKRKKTMGDREREIERHHS